MSNLAINLKKLRKAKRLSQTEFAKIFNLTRATVGAYEEARAEPKLDKLIEIAHYFGLTVDQLIAQKLTVNEIFHYDQKIASLSWAIPLVTLADKKKFINSLNQEQNFKFKTINIPQVNADIAFEIENFAGLKNCIVFGKKILKSKPDKWYISIQNNDYNITYGAHYQSSNNIWEVCCILTKDMDNITSNDLRLQRIEAKLELLLNQQTNKL